MKSLESALGALSAPFIPSSSPKSEAMSHISDITIGSSMLDIGQDVLSSAEEVVLNARRKQAILVGIIIKLQSYCRMFLAKKHRGRLRGLLTPDMMPGISGNKEKIRLDGAVLRIQTCVRTLQAKRKFSRIKYAAVKIGACNRGRRVRFAFTLLLEAICRTQALARGSITRERLAVVVAGRLAVYRRHIFLFWQQSCTPLSYRTKFWSTIATPTFLRLALAEVELRRLWEGLGLEAETNHDRSFQTSGDEIVSLAASVGLSNSFFCAANNVRT